MAVPFTDALRQVHAGFRLGRAIRQVPPSPSAFPGVIAERLRQREANLLRMLERHVFADSRSPYRPLFDLAGFDWPAVRQLVLMSGVDPALQRLAEAGVWLDVREFKGIRPAQRRGHTLTFREDDFVNRTAVATIHTQSSASRSRGTRSKVSIDDLRVHAAYRQWVESLYGVDHHSVVLWLTPGAGLFMSMLYALLGRPPRRWFSHARSGSLGSRVITTVTRLVGGTRVRDLLHYPPEKAADIARWIALHNRHGMVIDTFPSSALRLATAARDAGVRLGAFTFFVGGEPITPAKRGQVEALGYDLVPFYVFSEFGILGYGCRRPGATDDVHLLSDIIAGIRLPLTVDATGTTVLAYHFTTLLSSARRIMVNVNMGDYGEMAERVCGCPLESAGLRTHLWNVRSFEKLNAEGITFMGPSIVDLIEEVLPRTFGGEAIDYQLVEAEDEQGFTRLFLYVSPRVGPLDEEHVRAVALEELARAHLSPRYAAHAVHMWADAGTLRVVRQDPQATATGKIHHLHRLKT